MTRLNVERMRNVAQVGRPVLVKINETYHRGVITGIDDGPREGVSVTYLDGKVNGLETCYATYGEVFDDKGYALDWREATR